MIVESLIDVMSTTYMPNAECVIHVWKNSASQSTLRKLMVHTWAYVMSGKLLQVSGVHQVPQEFAVQVLIEKVSSKMEYRDGMAIAASGLKFVRDRKEQYHQHDRQRVRGDGK